MIREVLKDCVLVGDVVTACLNKLEGVLLF